MSKVEIPQPGASKLRFVNGFYTGLWLTSKITGWAGGHCACGRRVVTGLQRRDNMVQRVVGLAAGG